MQDLLDAANRAKRNAYAPYSEFHVGAAVRGEGGRIYSGCNVENSAYPEGLCAEAAAIAAMIMAGERRIVEVLVVADGDTLCSPCGGCRQKLSEFSAAETVVHICGPEGVRKTITMAELLPVAFGPHNLGPKAVPGT